MVPVGLDLDVNVVRTSEVSVGLGPGPGPGAGRVDPVTDVCVCLAAHKETWQLTELMLM